MVADHVLCIDEFKMGMMSQNCLSPGFSTMLYLLTNSISDKAIGDLRKYGDRLWIKVFIIDLGIFTRCFDGTL
jgi:hypothetical protein